MERVSHRRAAHGAWALAALALASCLPSVEEESTGADCPGGSFDPVSRACVQAAPAARRATGIVPLTRTAVLDEDTASRVALEYRSDGGGPADSCEVLAASVSPNLSRAAPAVPPSCSCPAGACELAVFPREDEHGTGGLYYRLRDPNTGWSDYVFLSVSIRPVNDPPVVSAGALVLALPEDGDPSAPQTQAAAPVPQTFNMCSLPGLAVTDADASDRAELEIVTRPSAGTVSCNACDCAGSPGACSCTFTPAAANDNGAPYATFDIRFRNPAARTGGPSPASATATVTVNIAPVNDRPAAGAPLDLTAAPLTEDVDGPLALAAIGDVDDASVTYEVARASNCGAGEPCTHSLEAVRRDRGVLRGCLDLDANGDTGAPGSDLNCEFLPYHNVHAASVVLHYRATDPSGAVSDWKKATFRIDPINDPPIPFFGFYRTAESRTALASDEPPRPFRIAAGPGGAAPPAIDPDEPDLSSPSLPPATYSITAQPFRIGVENCMAGDTDLDCDFSPEGDDGNLNTPGTPAKASGSLTGLSFEARSEGSSGNLITVGLASEDARGRHHPPPTDPSHPGPCAPGAGLVYDDCPGYFNRMVKVEADGTNVNIEVLLQATGYTTTTEDVQNLINNHPIASGFVLASGASPGAPAAAGLVSLSGGADAQAGARLEYKVNDGTSDNALPNGSVSIAVTPVNDTPVFCRHSTHEDAPECGLAGCVGLAGPSAGGVVPSSHTAERPVHYYDASTSTCHRSTGASAGDWEIAAYRCPWSASHADCGGGDCRGRGSPAGRVTPASHTASAPVIYQDSHSMACWRSVGAGPDDWRLLSPSLPEVVVNEGETIRIRDIVLDEGGNDPSEDAQRIHVSRFHSSAPLLISPRNVAIEHEADARAFPCPFSKGSCDGTDDCHQQATSHADPTGAVVPTGHTASAPLHFWANRSASLKCWRSTGTTAADWTEVLDNTLVGTWSSHNPDADGFSASGGGRRALGTAGSEDDDAVTLVMTPTHTEFGTTEVSMTLDDGGCQFSTGHGDCNGGDCHESNLGFADPTNNVTPASGTATEPVIYQNNASACYRSTGTTAGDWEAVPAWPATNVYFRVTVNPSSAAHNGWTNLAASGPAVNKYGAVVSAGPLLCPWSRSRCGGGGDCAGAGSPKGPGAFAPPAVAADGDYAIYHDERADKCYFWNPRAAQPDKWEEFANRCDLTQAGLASECHNASCVFDGGETPATAITPTALDRRYAVHDAAAGSFACLKSFGTGTGDVEAYDAAGSATLAWEPFTPNGGHPITGHNVHRRTAGGRFGGPVNKDPVPASATSYVDDAASSTAPPVPGAVYYYQVRPVIRGVGTVTKEPWSTARIFVPKKNMTFVHRRVVNKRMCRLMGRPDGDIDGLNHNRCAYSGPGDDPRGFYDVGRDFHVATFEAACPYTVDSGSCATGDGHCVADQAPGAGDGDDGDFFYDRSTGACHWKDPGTSAWSEVDPVMATILSEYRSADADLRRTLEPHRPPLVLVSQASASSLCRDDGMQQGGLDPGCSFAIGACDTADGRCTGTADPTSGSGVTAARAGVLFWNPADRSCWRARSATAGDWARAGGSAAGRLPMRLPTRKEQLAFSFWDQDVGNFEAEVLERGFSLDVSSKCNSSLAHGLRPGYADVEAPVSQHLYSLPGTFSSGIRSMATGVPETRSCRSLSGARDLIGNVSEWTGDSVSCPLPHSCRFDGTANPDYTVQSSTRAGSSVNVAGGFTFGWHDGNGDGIQDAWGEDGHPMGPCVDGGADLCDGGPLTSWILGNEANEAGRIVIPLGLPAHADFPDNHGTDNAAGAFSEIGPTSGVPIANLRGDTVEMDSDELYCPYERDSSDCGGDCTSTATGRGTPDGGVAPASHSAADPVHFLNEGNGQCYRSTGTTSASWQLVGCNYSKGACGGSDCAGAASPVGSTAPSGHTALSPVVYYDSAADACHVSTGTTASDWRAYSGAALGGPIAGGAAGGGGFRSGSGAGQFHLELIDHRSGRDRDDVGFRCVMPVPESFYTE